MISRNHSEMHGERYKHAKLRKWELHKCEFKQVRITQVRNYTSGKYSTSKTAINYRMFSTHATRYLKWIYKWNLHALKYDQVLYPLESCASHCGNSNVYAIVDICTYIVQKMNAYVVLMLISLVAALSVDTSAADCVTPGNIYITLYVHIYIYIYIRACWNVAFFLCNMRIWYIHKVVNVGYFRISWGLHALQLMQSYKSLNRPQSSSVMLTSAQLSGGNAW